MQPQWLAEYLVDFLQMLLGMSYHMGEYGALLYKWLGSITVKVGAVPIKHLDLGEKLASLEFNDSFGNMPREQREQHFNEWKMSTIAWREARGLSARPTDAQHEARPTH